MPGGLCLITSEIRENSSKISSISNLSAVSAQTTLNNLCERRTVSSLSLSGWSRAAGAQI